jgi:NAD(P)H-nitrite reductase
MDGYTETHLINNTYTISPTNYPVFYYALNYNVATPQGSSGWYLPSIGQWYSVIVNLGKVPTTSTTAYVAELGWKNGEISSCASNINNYLAALDNGYRVDKFYTSPGTSELYSATSEYTSNYSYRLYFQSGSGGNILWIDGNDEDNDKTLTWYTSRAAIAF